MFSLEGINSDLKPKEYKDLSDLANTSKILLYFYPKDNTPGCTNQAKDFTRLKADFAKLDITIVGCSPNSIASHEKFITKQELDILLLSDPEKELIKEYGAWGEKKNYGRVYEGLIRSTFLLNTSNGEILEEWRNIRAKGHADRILKILSEA